MRLGNVIPMNKFMYHKGKNLFTAFASDLRGYQFLGQIFQDSIAPPATPSDTLFANHVVLRHDASVVVDEGFVMESHLTGNKVIMNRQETLRDVDDILGWVFTGVFKGRSFTVKIFND